MATQKQIAANRRNAQKSTGPKTPQGKRTVAQNAATHGLTAAAPVIAGEDPAAFSRFRQQLLTELRPRGPLETMLADRIIDLSWRLKRTGRLQIATFDTLTAADQPDGRPDPLALGRIAVSDFSSANVLDRLLMHERRIEQSLYKTMLELQRLQFIRTKYQSLLMDHEDYDDWEFRESIAEEIQANETAKANAAELLTDHPDPECRQYAQELKQQLHEKSTEPPNPPEQSAAADNRHSERSEKSIFQPSPTGDPNN
jgi:hypothetical protein